jgi:predicted TIM-barrel fold metal-dependent hydrolase
MSKENDVQDHNGGDPFEAIIDCDAHFTEPPDLWLSRTPKSMHDRVPVQRTVDGRTAWYLDGEVWASVGGNTIGVGRKKVLGTHVLDPFEAIDPVAWSVPDRVALLDELGIRAQVVYPNGVGFASNHIFAIEDTDQRRNILSTYNDFLADVQEESNGRLFPQAMLPIWDMDFTVTEMTRLLDRGIRGFTLSDKPELIGLPELWEDYYAPMWDIFNESGVVANFHIGSGARKEELEAQRASRLQKTVDAPSSAPTVASPTWREFGPQRRLAVYGAQIYMSNVRIICNLLVSNLFDRYPNIKIVSAESGIGWVPFVLEALEYQLDESVTNEDEVTYAKRRPREYFKDHIYVMFWFENSGPLKLIDDIGAENVLVETDVPHPTCLYPAPMDHFKKVMSDLDPYVIRRVLHDNGAALYGIQTPASVG